MPYDVYDDGGNYIGYITEIGGIPIKGKVSGGLRTRIRLL